MADAKKNTFAYSLWNGFDTVYDRLTKGRHDLKNFKAYLDERVKLEESYASQLQKLTTSKPEAETSAATLTRCWNDVREGSKSTVQAHLELARIMGKEIGKALEDQMKHLKTEKTRMRTQYDKLFEKREKASKNHQRARAKYEESVKNADNAIFNRNAGQKERLPEKSMKKLEQDVVVRLKDEETSHNAYRDSVQALKAAQEEFDANLKESLDLCEVLERERIKFMGVQYARYAEMHDLYRAATDKIHELLKQSSAEVNSDADVDAFITENEAKERPPEHVKYEQIKSEFINSARGGGPMPTSIAPPSGPAKTNGSPAPPAAAAAVAAPVSSSPQRKDSAPERKQGNRPSVMKDPKTSQATLTNVKFATALYDFDGTQDGDLSFKQGQRIKILEFGDADWWQGELDGKTGSIPKNYVELCQEDGSAGAEQPSLMSATCRALYDFEAQGADELPFKAGDVLYVTGELNGWYLGKTADGSRVGIFPSNYVELMAS